MDRRTQQERTEESRRRLLAAATTLFGTKGYAGTTLTDIGREAGFSRGLLAYHFGTKEACLREVLADIRAQSHHLATVGLGDRRGVAAIEHVAETYLRSYIGGSQNGRTMFVAIVESISSNPELLELTIEADEAFRSGIAQRLTEAIDDGELPHGIDVHTHSVLITGLLRGIALQWLVAPSAVDLESVVPIALKMIHTSLAVAQPATPHPDARGRTPRPRSSAR